MEALSSSVNINSLKHCIIFIHYLAGQKRRPKGKGQKGAPPPQANYFQDFNNQQPYMQNPGQPDMFYGGQQSKWLYILSNMFCLRRFTTLFIGTSNFIKSHHDNY